MGKGAARVHPVFEGHHEQQGRPEGHLRAQGGFDIDGAFLITQPSSCDAGGGETDGRDMYFASRWP